MAIEKLGRENNFKVYATADSSYFTDNNLKKYAAIIFCNTSGNVLNPFKKAAMERFVQAGGGFVGIHCASSTEKEWLWYTKLVGAIFIGHSDPPRTIDVVDRDPPSTKQLPARWAWRGEWYNFKDIQPACMFCLKPTKPPIRAVVTALTTRWPGTMSLTAADRFIRRWVILMGHI